MNYEVFQDLTSQGYAMRTDIRGKIHIGMLENLLERFAEPRYWTKINNALFNEGTYHTVRGTTFNLIAWIWKEAEANKIAWRIFLDKAATGYDTRWVTSDAMYSIGEISEDSILE